MTLFSVNPPPPTARPHRRPAEGDSEKSSHCWDRKWLRPSVQHYLITCPTPYHQMVWLQAGFTRNTYVGIVLTPPTMILVPDKLDMGPSEKRPSLASRYKAQRPTNQQLSTVQTDSVIPDNNRILPPLYPPAGRDQHSPSYRPTTTSRRDPFHRAFRSWPQGHKLKNTKASPMRMVTAWVWIEYSVVIDPVIPAPWVRIEDSITDPVIPAP